MTLRDIFNEVVSMLKRHSAYKVENWLQSLGAKNIGSGAFSEAYLLELSWGKVVVKISEKGVNMPERADFERSPTLREYFLRPLFASENVMVQPFTETGDYDRNYEAVFALRPKLRSESPCGNCDYDCHSGNVGYWKGKMWIFDAMSYRQYRAHQDGESTHYNSENYSYQDES